MPSVIAEPKTGMIIMVLVCGHGAAKFCYWVVECDFSCREMGMDLDMEAAPAEDYGGEQQHHNYDQL